MSNADNIRTRFAPSPTGFLHIGGARTALFSWLYARHHGGSFVLRIEDTDEARSSPELSRSILEALAWLGIDHDEEVIYQSERRARYAEAVTQLLDEGKAYRCYCTRSELEALRAEQIAAKQKPRYDGRCRTRASPRPGVDPVIRFITPRQGSVVFDDRVRGRVQTENAELDDLVIMRADGAPTYNFSVVIDDADMRISHVVRGDDHLSNTPRQIHIQKALAIAQPAYAHLPMILDADGKRMSKRDGAISVEYYRERGYLPQALLNYLVRLGWSRGNQEIFSLQEMIDCFDLGAVSSSAAAVNPDKLDWLNSHYLNEMPIDELVDSFTAQLNVLGWDTAGGPSPATVIPLLRERYKTVVAMAEGSQFLYCDEAGSDGRDASRYLTPDTRRLLEYALSEFAKVDCWQEDALKRTLKSILATLDIGMGKLGKPLRAILTAGAAAPDLALTMEWIGKRRCLARIAAALKER